MNRDQPVLRRSSPTPTPVKAFVATLGVLLLLGVLGVGYFIWNFDRPPFDLALLHRLQAGMSRSEVRAILGAPTSTTRSDWIYARFMAWPHVRVQFDHQDRFTASEYDS